MVLPFLATAQNSRPNPTVQVTNDYQGKLKEMEKASKPTVVPDSLYKFNLDFDYSGFENPYKGVDYFNPFRTDLQIQKRSFPYKKFYLKAGAGYTLRPELQAVWVFNPESRFKVSAYASHDSYFGPYNKMTVSDGRIVKDGQNSWNGYESKSLGGFSGRGECKNVALITCRQYDGIHAKDAFVSPAIRAFDTGSAEISVFSHSDSPWKYNVRADYSYGNDRVKLSDSSPFAGGTEQNAVLSGGFGYSFGTSSIELDVDVDGKFGTEPGRAGNLGVSYNGIGGVLSPHYHFSKDKLSMGVGLSVLFATGRNVNCGKNKVEFWPSVNLQWQAVKDKMDLYLDAGASNSLYGRQDQASSSLFVLADADMSIVKKYNLDGGIRGHLFDKLTYDLCLGYEKNENLPVYAVERSALVGPDPAFLTCMVHRNINDGFASFRIKGNFTAWEFTAGVKYRYYMTVKENAITPPALTADAMVRYNILDRVSLWVGADYSSKYVSCDCQAPGFVNLQAGARFKFTSKLSFYIQGRNLLNQTMQFIPVYAQKGLSGTAGVVVNF